MATPPLQEAALADLDALLVLHERFAASNGQAFEPAVARATLGALLTRPELGRIYHIVHAGRPVGYAALCFGYSLEWGSRDAFIALALGLLHEDLVDRGRRRELGGRGALQLGRLQRRRATPPEPADKLSAFWRAA